MSKDYYSEAAMNYPSPMKVLGSPFYPLTHDLEELDDYLVELFLYKDYAYIVEQSLVLIENLKDEIFQPSKINSHSKNTLNKEADCDKTLQIKSLIYELEILLFAITRNSSIRFLVEARGCSIHSAIRMQVDNVADFPDDVLVYLYAAMKASQALIEVVDWMCEIEEKLFEKSGSGIIEGATERLRDAKENDPDIYATLINEIRAENLQGEVDTALYSSILLNEANQARLLASVYPSLDEAKRQKESLQLFQESKREASAKGGRKGTAYTDWAKDYIEASFNEHAFDEKGHKQPRTRLSEHLEESILPKVLEGRKKLNPKDASSLRIPSSRTISRWLEKLGYDEFI